MWGWEWDGVGRQWGHGMARWNIGGWGVWEWDEVCGSGMGGGMSVSVGVELGGSGCGRICGRGGEWARGYVWAGGSGRGGMCGLGEWAWGDVEAV